MGYGQALSLIGRMTMTSGAAGGKSPWTGACLFELDTKIHKVFFYSFMEGLK
jgi:hypothetical protein